MEKATIIGTINTRLEAVIGADLPVLAEIRDYVIESGGKRIRPLLHFYFARLLGYEGDEWSDVGVVGELIHAASLLHDDVVDESGLRRGRPSINKVYNNKTAVLTGDFFLANALDHIGTLRESKRIYPVFTRVVRKLAVGELLQMQWEGNLSIPEEVYEEIITCKTAVLFGAMTESAAVLAGRDAAEAERYRAFGEKLGRIFQLRDDFLDYYGDEARNGKRVFEDFRRGLVTRPVIVLRSLLGAGDLQTLEQTWKSDERRASGDGVEALRGLTEKNNLHSRLAGEIDQEIAGLIAFIENYPASEYSDRLTDNLRELRVSPN